MKSLIDLEKEIIDNNHVIAYTKDAIQSKEIVLKEYRARLEKEERALAQNNIYLSHIKAIHRLAQYQFSRLRNTPGAGLTVADGLELNKWINRAKSEDGLMQIKCAFEELDKYCPSEIKTNLYALVQKIIIGGAFHKGKK
jgi:hypothetical protein